MCYLFKKNNLWYILRLLMWQQNNKSHEENEINMVNVTNLFQNVGKVGNTVYIKIKSLYLQSPPNVQILEFIKSWQNPGAGNPTHDVNPGAAIHGPGTLFVDNGTEAIKTAFVFDLFSAGHHHPSSDCVHWICGL